MEIIIIHNIVVPIVFVGRAGGHKRLLGSLTILASTRGAGTDVLHVRRRFRAAATELQLEVDIATLRLTVGIAQTAKAARTIARSLLHKVETNAATIRQWNSRAARSGL